MVWSARALRNLADIHAYIGQFAPLAAQRFTMRLIATVETLAENPDRGGPVIRQVRELMVVAPYIVRYRVTEAAVEIVRIKHGAQEPS